MRLLDLFCGAGGSAVGYHRAGFEVVGVDIKPQKNYPFAFHQRDALDYLAEHGRDYDVIHASPPCRNHTLYATQWGADPGTGWLLKATYVALRHGSVPWVLENVVGAEMPGSIMLCGSMFGLGVRRHRLFSASIPLPQMECDHKSQGSVITVTGHSGGRSTRRGDVNRAPAEDWAEAMDTPWMSTREMAQAIPPAFTQWIGKQFT